MYWEQRGGAKYLEGISVPVLKFPTYLGYQQEWVSNILRSRQSSVTRSTSLLDFGCGTGLFFKCWRRIPEVFAYDRSCTMLHQARVLNRQEEYGYKISGPDSANRATTPFGDNHFDYVMMMAVLAHLSHDDMAVFADELRRISKPGAVWGIVTSIPFEEGANEYMWNHDYEEFLRDDTVVLDDHLLPPYRHLEVVYG